MDFNTASVADLRKELRLKHPEAKGTFGVLATKEVCISILSGAKTFADYELCTMADGRTGIQLVGEKGTPLAAANTPAEGITGLSDPDQEVVSKTLKMLEVMDPASAKKLEAMIVAGKLAAQEVKDLHAQGVVAIGADKTTEIVSANGQTIKLAKVDVPIISTEAEPEKWKWVPKRDAHFRFDYWRAERVLAGATKLTQDAEDLFKLLLAGWPIHLFGPPGVGKTTVIEQFCAGSGWPCIRMQGDKDVTTADFLGEKTVEAGNIRYIYGVLPLAMKIGAIFIADEIDYFPADCRTALNPVLEPGGRLVLTANGGEVIEPHPNFRLVATSNTKGFGDDSGLYPDAKVQNAALLSRLKASFNVAWLTVKQEAMLLCARSGIAKDLAELIAKVAADTRKAAAENQLLYAMTHRHTMAWAEGAAIVGLEHAFALCVLNKVPEQDATVIVEIAQRHLGDKIKGLSPATSDTAVVVS